MNMNEYQHMAARTALYPKEQGIEYTSLGLVGEAGEIANQVKKIIRDDEGRLTADRRNNIVDELGDVLWYVANLAREVDCDLEYIANDNIAKLARRSKYNEIKGDKRNGI